jgi:predicted ferric reductase
MFSQSKTRQNEPMVGAPRQRTALWFWMLLAIAGGVAFGVAVLPALLGSVSGSSPHVFWYVSRAAAFVAYVLLWMSMLAGLGITSKLSRFWPGMPASFELHRYTALLGLGFALFHALILLGDKYINYTLVQLLIPFMSSNYLPEWVGFGQVAFYLLSVVALSFYFRDRIGVRTWRLIHMLSFALFLAAMVHGLQSGTDSTDWWAQGLYWVSIASVLFGSVYRVIALRIGRSRKALAASGLVAAAGRAQVSPSRRQALVP